MSDYPEHDRLSTVKDQSQAIGEFLEWLAGEGIHLGHYQAILDPEVKYQVEPGRSRVRGARPVEYRDVWRIRDLDPFMSTFVGGYWETEAEARDEVNALEADRRKDAQESKRFLPLIYSVQKLLAEHFNIDLDKIETEKRAMLDRIRAQS